MWLNRFDEWSKKQISEVTNINRETKEMTQEELEKKAVAEALSIATPEQLEEAKRAKEGIKMEVIGGDNAEIQEAVS